MIGEVRELVGCNYPLSTEENVVIQLREISPADLDVFFEQQQDKSANYMAGYGPKNPSDRGVFDLYWQEILSSELATAKAITLDGDVVGGIIAAPAPGGVAEINYWVAAAHWGKGITQEALSLFLQDFDDRPVQARTIADNHGAIKILEKQGFTKVGEDKSFSNVRGEVVEELILELD